MSRSDRTPCFWVWRPECVSAPDGNWLPSLHREHLNGVDLLAGAFGSFTWAAPLSIGRRSMVGKRRRVSRFLFIRSGASGTGDLDTRFGKAAAMRDEQAISGRKSPGARACRPARVRWISTASYPAKCARLPCARDLAPRMPCACVGKPSFVAARSHTLDARSREGESLLPPTGTSVQRWLERLVAGGLLGRTRGRVHR